ncbi:MAG: hypothetical protein L0Z62_13080 [Gemmataceae bacterium]|nr:hypothetical protein [Gemmataceae bacterium]
MLRTVGIVFCLMLAVPDPGPGQQKPRSVNDLLATLDNPRAPVSEGVRAAEALGQMGADAREAVPRLAALALKGLGKK